MFKNWDDDKKENSELAETDWDCRLAGQFSRLIVHDFFGAAHQTAPSLSTHHWHMLATHHTIQESGELPQLCILYNIDLVEQWQWHCIDGDICFDAGKGGLITWWLAGVRQIKMNPRSDKPRFVVPVQKYDGMGWYTYMERWEYEWYSSFPWRPHTPLWLARGEKSWTKLYALKV